MWKISFFFSVALILKILTKDFYCQFSEKEPSNPLPIDEDLPPEIFALWKIIVTKEAHYYVCTHVHTYVFIYADSHQHPNKLHFFSLQFVIST